MTLGAMLAFAACTTTGPAPVEPATGGAGPSVGSSADSTTPATPEVTLMTTAGPFTLSSGAFAEGGPIPREYSCQGADVSPALTWTGTPAGTAELILVVDDPDAGGFVHWIALIGGAEVALPRDVPATAQAPQQGINGFGDVGWGGPCPPSGTHHYRFTLSALAAATGLTGHPTISQVRAALSKATIRGTAVLTGTYQKT